MRDTEPMTSLSDSIDAIARFEGISLKLRISQLEKALQHASPSDCLVLLSEQGISSDLLRSGAMVKHAAAQIDVVLHAIGILVSLPHLLREGETIQALSLGAGTGASSFDLETDVRIAEFKFANWQGGADSMRQKALFKDFYSLAEAETTKERYLYVTDATHPRQFLNSQTTLRSAMSRNARLWERFQQRYGERFSVVYEYFQYRRDLVNIVALSEVLPDLWAGPERPNQEELY